MAFDMGSVFSGFGSSLVNIGVPLIMLLFVGVFAIILYNSGMLTRYPVTCILRVPRQGGGYKPVIVPGRSIKGGKIEMKFGMFDKLSVSEPKEECTEEGQQADQVSLPSGLKFVKKMNTIDVLEGVMNSKEEVTWFKGVEVDDAEIKFKASVPENAQMVFAVAHDSAYVRTHKQKAWLQYLPTIALVITAFMFLGGCYILANMFKDMGNGFHADYANFEEHLTNSTIVVYKTQSGSTATGFPNSPTTANPNMPPG